MRYVVTGGTGFIGRRVVSRILDRFADAEVWVLVRRESLTRFERLATQRDRAVGRPGEGAGRRPDRRRSRPLRRDHRRARFRRSRGALRRRLRHHRRRGRAARRERGGHKGGDRAGAPARRDAAPRVVDRGGRDLSRRIHRRRFRRRAGPADAVSPDQVRGRAAGALGARAALPRSTGPRWSSATRARARWTRSTAPTTSSASWRSWPKLPSFTPVLLPDTGRTNIVPVDYVVDALTELIHVP